MSFLSLRRRDVWSHRIMRMESRRETSSHNRKISLYHRPNHNVIPFSPPQLGFPAKLHSFFLPDTWYSLSTHPCCRNIIPELLTDRTNIGFTPQKLRQEQRQLTHPIDSSSMTRLRKNFSKPPLIFSPSASQPSHHNDPKHHLRVCYLKRSYINYLQTWFN